MSTAFSRGGLGDVIQGGAPIHASSHILREVHGDALDVIALENELEAIKAQVYMRPFPPNQFLSRVNIDTSGGTGLEATGFTEMDSRAKFRRMGDKSADFDQADHKRKKRTFPVLSYISGWGFWLKEVESAQRLGLDLNTRSAFATRLAYDDLLELHAMIGEPTEGVYGFFNSPDIPNTTLGTALTSTSTADQIFDQLMDLVDSIEANSEGVYSALAMLVPGPLYRKCRRTTFAGVTETVSQRFQDVTGFDLQPVERFKSVDTLGTGATTSVALIGAFTAESHEKQVPRPYQQLAPHIRNAGLETVVPVITDIGGLHVYQPGNFLAVQNIYTP